MQALHYLKFKQDEQTRFRTAICFRMAIQKESGSMTETKQARQVKRLFLPKMNMSKMGSSLLVVKVCTFIPCVKQKGIGKWVVG